MLPARVTASPRLRTPGLPQAARPLAAIRPGMEIRAVRISSRAGTSASANSRPKRGTMANGSSAAIPAQPRAPRRSVSRDVVVIWPASRVLLLTPKTAFSMAKATISGTSAIAIATL